MSDRPPLRDVIARHGLRANKALGQNFLLDPQLLRRIAAISGNLDGETVYEVGPGPGGLTRALLDSGANVIAVERDSRCIAALEELGQTVPGRLDIIEGDALEIDEMDQLGGAQAHIVANLPYNVGTALLVRWLTALSWPPWWKSLTLMFQQEVAQRIVAEPGSSAYGRLSILSQWRSTAKIALSVHRSAFVPPPKVMSAVVHLTPADAPESVDVADLAQLTQQSFGKRRKMLRQSLKNWPEAIDAMQQLDIDQTRRPEQLSVEEFVAIAREIGAIRD